MKKKVNWISHEMLLWAKKKIYRVFYNKVDIFIFQKPSISIKKINKNGIENDEIEFSAVNDQSWIFTFGSQKSMIERNLPNTKAFLNLLEFYFLCRFILNFADLFIKPWKYLE